MSEKLKRRIGYAMLAAPFVALFIGGALAIGLLKITLVAAGVAFFVVWLLVAGELAA